MKDSETGVLSVLNTSSGIHSGNGGTDDLAEAGDYEVKPITIDKNYHLVAPYKNITFRCRILVMTPQLSTINMYDLLLTLRDMSEERSGEIDSSGTDLNIGFSIVGENPGDQLSNTDRDRIFANVTAADKRYQNKITTWRDKNESKGANIATSILNSALSIL